MVSKKTTSTNMSHPFRALTMTLVRWFRRIATTVWKFRIIRAAAQFGVVIAYYVSWPFYWVYTFIAKRYHHLSLRHPFMRTLWFRTIATVFILVTVISPLTVIITSYLTTRTYRMSQAELSLIGKSTVDTSLIKATSAAYTYNRADQSAPKDLQKVLTLAANKEDATGKKPYQAELSINPKDGITFSDAEDNRGFSLTPTFRTNDAKLDDEGRVVYPTNTTERHVYSFKNNGIKSDIILSKAPKDDTKTYSWDLNLGSSLEARMLPSGGVGIYSGDPSLYGNLQISDKKSQDLIDNARKTGAKNTLVFELPAPFIVDANNNKTYDDVRYSLTNNNQTLTLTATNLNTKAYPLTIDPTITVTTTADFRQQTGDTGNTDYSTTDEIRRGVPATGEINTWSTDASSYFSIPRYGHTTVAYNGYMYVLGGLQNSFDTNCKDAGTSQYCNDVQYAAINADGTLGTWTTDASSYFSIPRRNHTTVAYNGYMYVIGGEQVSSDTNCKDAGFNSYCNDVQYAPINADGTLGTWTTDASSYFSTPRRYHATVAYNGYMYLLGGYQASSATTCKDAGTNNYCNDVQYAPINADGTLGTWTTDTSSYFSIPRSGHTTVAYNGYLYVLGGTQATSDTNCKDSGTSDRCNDVQYAPIRTSGSGAAQTDASSYFSFPRAYHTTVAYNGYMYVLGGYQATSATTCKDAGTNNYCNDVQYAAINADGTLGTWTTDTSSYFAYPRYYHTTVAYNGYMYVLGGYQATSATTCKDAGTSNYCNDVQYAAINADGTLGAWTTDTSSYFSVPRQGHTTVAYNGYIYVVGGLQATSATTCKDAGTSNYCNDVQYAAINADGTLGTWTTDTSSYFSIPRYWHSSIAYDGYIYVLGGGQASSATTCKDAGTSQYCNDVQYAAINADGTLGTWTTDTSSYFSIPRAAHANVAYNGHIYVLGGWQASSTTTCKNAGTNQQCNDVQFLRIGSSGGIDTAWTTDTSSYFSIPRERHTSVAYNGYMYVLGGYQVNSNTNCKNAGTNTFCNDVQYAAINAD